MRTPPSKRAPKWRVVAESVRGAAHVRRGEQNQDATEWHPARGTGLPLIVAISDGHGSPRSFRSERGARIAVTTAITETRRLLAELPDTADAARCIAENALPAAIVRAWEEQVRQDLTAHPFTTRERRHFVARYGSPAWKLLRAGPLLAYGATLLIAAVTRTLLLLAQIGDGDIVCISPSGCATRALAADPRLFAGETTSLCLPDAAASFFMAVQPMTADRPALVLLATDGCANSYEDDDGFLSVGADLLAQLREDGAAAVQRDLPVWLEQVTREGSGDDVTLGLLCLL